MFVFVVQARVLCSCIVGHTVELMESQVVRLQSWMFAHSSLFLRKFRRTKVLCFLSFVVFCCYSVFCSLYVSYLI